MRTNMHAFDLASCLEAANRGRVDAWVDAYLAGGPWANEGLRQGLHRAPRYWLGPLKVPLASLERCCGPEETMEFPVPAGAWEERITRYARNLSTPEALPPLIVEWRSGTLSVRDGNHRLGAMHRAGWTHGWIIVWCNSLADREAGRAALCTRACMPDAKVLAAHLRRDGWVRLPGAVPHALVESASAAIAGDLASNFDPARQSEYDHRSYCPDLRGTPVIRDLLTKTAARDYLDAWLGWDAIGHDGGQIAIRRAHNAEHEHAPVWHIDGVGSGRNGLQAADPISNFTALIGVYLTPVQRAFAGNFTVWPGSHVVLQDYFRARGEGAMHEGMPNADLGQPLQLMALPGDVLIGHYQLAHAAAVNLSDSDRIAIYFRLWLSGIGERRWQLLTNIWEGWRL